MSVKNGLLVLGALVALTACNSVYVKPNSMEPGTKVHALYGGYSMRRSIKERLEERGYQVMIGHKVYARETISDDGELIEIDSYRIPKDVRYDITVRERREYFNPFWCAFNGFWWWNFNVSIMDRKDGAELMTWRGRGCANSSLRKLNNILDEMERKDDRNTDKN